MTAGSEISSVIAGNNALRYSVEAENALQKAGLERSTIEKLNESCYHFDFEGDWVALTLFRAETKQLEERRRRCFF